MRSGAGDTRVGRRQDVHVVAEPCCLYLRMDAVLKVNHVGRHQTEARLTAGKSLVAVPVQEGIALHLEMRVSIVGKQDSELAKTVSYAAMSLRAARLWTLQTVLCTVKVVDVSSRDHVEHVSRHLLEPVPLSSVVIQGAARTRSEAREKRNLGRTHAKRKQIQVCSRITCMHYRLVGAMLLQVLLHHLSLFLGDRMLFHRLHT